MHDIIPQFDELFVCIIIAFELPGNLGLHRKSPCQERNKLYGIDKGSNTLYSSLSQNVGHKRPAEGTWNSISAHVRMLPC